MPRDVADVKSQLADWSAALAFTRRCADVDNRRIALWGTSFSGGHVIATAVREHRINAVISQCLFTDGRAASPRRGPRAELRPVLLAIADVIGARLGREPIMLQFVGPPGSGAGFTEGASEARMKSNMSEGETLPDKIAARIALQSVTYRPGRRAAAVNCPPLMCVCEKDELTPPEVSAAYGRKYRVVR